MFKTIIFIILMSAAHANPTAPNVSGEMVVIVNPKNEIAELDRRFVAAAFLKKSTQWADGKIIRPVDLTPVSETRHSFSKTMLGRTVYEVKNYWQRQIFSGHDVPPPELDSDLEVINYVKRHTGGIGYVSKDADLTDTKVISVK